MASFAYQSRWEEEGFDDVTLPSEPDAGRRDVATPIDKKRRFRSLVTPSLIIVCINEDHFSLSLSLSLSLCACRFSSGLTLFCFGTAAPLTPSSLISAAVAAPLPNSKSRPKRRRRAPKDERRRRRRRELKRTTRRHAAPSNESILNPPKSLQVAVDDVVGVWPRVAESKKKMNSKSFFLMIIIIITKAARNKAS